MSELPLLAEMRQLLEETSVRLAGDPRAIEVTKALARLDEPLRVAIAGQVSAGKSTLLNALVGEQLATTDASECTRIVTWYRNGTSRRVTVQMTDGTSRELAFERTDRGLVLDLGQLPADEVDHIDVTWPATALETMTLIDTPGIGSAAASTSAVTEDLLTPRDDRANPADAVIYLMRHMHATDFEFLEAFRDTRVARATPTNTIALLARSDEIGVGQLNAMQSAGRIADRYAADPKLRRLSSTALPVAALIGQAGGALRERDYQLLASIADLEPASREAMLLSVDRFVTASLADSNDLRTLLDRLGLFGVRLSVAWIASGEVHSASDLASHLVEHSGLPRLRAELMRRFGTSREILKARSALLALEPLGLELDREGDRWLAGEVERALAGAHEFVEIRLADALRSGTVPVPAGELAEMEHLLGLHGMAPADRVGLTDDAEPAEIRRALHHHLARWQRRAESPVSARPVSEAARVLVRTCEGLLSRSDS